jgi:membrane-associated protease RseP (regulator of RpoE activity)
MSSLPDQPHEIPQSQHEHYAQAEVVPATENEAPPRVIPLLPVALFLLTCYTTYTVGNVSVGNGLAYSASLMFILLSHELGHYIQARRYRVPASLPYFIPMPFGPLGTMGAVIAMRGNMGSRKALFDIGITGPLAGLVPTLICCAVGLNYSKVINVPVEQNMFGLGEPLLFKWLLHLILGPLPPGSDVILHPLAFAGWVGVFITALNLIPIGQLDGGHVLYALLRRKANVVAVILLAAAFALVVMTRHYDWSIMLVLLALMGPRHPPTANDEEPLGTTRIVLGWLTLGFVIVGFTPTPFVR